MRNLPTICPWFVAQALSSVRDKYQDVYCYHYMDDILLAAPSKELLETVEKDARHSLAEFGLIVAPEEVQRQEPWKYLGMNVLKRTVSPQPIKLKLDVKTLSDVQKLAGMLNWLRPCYLGLTNEQRQPFLQLLKGDTDLLAPRHFTPAALALVKEVKQLISARHVWRVDITLPLSGFILME